MSFRYWHLGIGRMDFGEITRTRTIGDCEAKGFWKSHTIAAFEEEAKHRGEVEFGTPWDKYKISYHEEK